MTLYSPHSARPLSPQLANGVRTRLAEIRDARRVTAQLTQFIGMVNTVERTQLGEAIHFRNEKGWDAEWLMRKERESCQQ